MDSDVVWHVYCVLLWPGNVYNGSKADRVNTSGERSPPFYKRAVGQNFVIIADLSV